MNHVPDETRTIKWNGKDVQIRIFVNETDIPYADCHDDNLDNAPDSWSGYDVGVEAVVKIEGQSFTGSSGLCAIWGPSSLMSKTLDSHLEDEIIPEAISDMRNNIISISNGNEVKRMRDLLFEEEKKMRVAEWINRKYIVG